MRKILAPCALKGVEVRIDPIVAFVSTDDFTDLNPLRRIPVWIDEEVTLADSSVILQYVEERWPEPSIWPADRAQRARARWLEEYADTRLADVLLGHVFFERIVRPHVLGEEGDLERARRGADTLAPEVFDYLERQLADSPFLCGDQACGADFAMAPAFLNARAARCKPKRDTWPRLAAWLERMEAETPLGRLNEMAWAMLAAPPAELAEKMRAFGYEASDRSWGGGRPRRGPMSWG